MSSQTSLIESRLQRRIAAILIVLTIGVIVLIAPSSARAASGTWNVNTDGTWSTASNWVGNVIADGAGFTGTFNFNINSARTVTIDTTSRTLGIINIGDFNNNNSYTIASSGGATLTFDNTPNGVNAQLNQTSGSNGDTISAPILLKSSLDITNVSSSAATLTISGAIASSATSGTQTITYNSANAATFTGTITNGITGGTVALTKSGNGNLTLSGTLANSYTGLTTVSAGTLTLSKTTALQTTAIAGNLSVSGGTVNYGSTGADNQIADTSAVTLNSGSITLGARTETFDSTLGSLTINGGSLTVGSGGLNLLNGTMTFNGGTIDKTAASGAYNLTSTVTYQATSSGQALFSSTGGANLALGAVGRTEVFDIANSNTLAANLAEMTVSAPISGGVGVTVEKQGTGVLVFSGTNTYQGPTSVTGGTLEIANNAGTNLGKLSNTNGVTVSSGGTLLLSGTTGVTDRINNSAGVTLDGTGKFSTGGLSEGTRPSSPGASNGAAGMGALTLQNTNPGAHATIDFLTGANGSSLVFSSLSGGSGAFLDILNWTGSIGSDTGATGNDRLLFAANPGLTNAQLANIAFFDDAGTLITQGATIIPYGNEFELVAVPEPSTWIGAVLALGAIAFTQRKRFGKTLKS